MRWILMTLVLVLAGGLLAYPDVLNPRDLTALAVQTITTVTSEALELDTTRTDLAAVELDVDTLQTQVGSFYLIAAGFATVTNDTLEITVNAADSADICMATYLSPDGDGMAEWWRLGCWADSTLTFYTEEADSSDGVIQYLVIR